MDVVIETGLAGNFWDKIGDFVRNNQNTLSTIPVVGQGFQVAGDISQNNVDRNKAERLAAENAQLQQLYAQQQLQLQNQNNKTEREIFVFGLTKTETAIAGGVVGAGLLLLYLGTKDSKKTKK